MAAQGYCNFREQRFDNSHHNDTLGKLREHELEMMRLKEMESAEKKTRSLALKSKVAEIETNEDSSKEDSDTENLSLLTKKFQKFIKLKSRAKHQ